MITQLAHVSGKCPFCKKQFCLSSMIQTKGPLLRPMPISFSRGEKTDLERQRLSIGSCPHCKKPVVAVINRLGILDKFVISKPVIKKKKKRAKVTNVVTQFYAPPIDDDLEEPEDDTFHWGEDYEA